MRDAQTAVRRAEESATKIANCERKRQAYRLLKRRSAAAKRAVSINSDSLLLAAEANDCELIVDLLRHGPGQADIEWQDRVGEHSCKVVFLLLFHHFRRMAEAHFTTQL